MKLTKILMSIAVIAIACSCKKEKMAAETESIPQTHEPITRSVTDAMLSFGSEEEMFDRIQQLKNMDEAEMAAWYESQCPDFCRSTISCGRSSKNSTMPLQWTKFAQFRPAAKAKCSSTPIPKMKTSLPIFRQAIAERNSSATPKAMY